MSLLKLFFKTNTQQSENETTIKDFFFYHHGDGMSMDRDDPQKYKQYRTLSEATIELWRQELIAQDFELLISDNADNQWIIVGNLIRLISSSKNLVEDHFKKLLTTIIEISSTLNKRQRILILEHFASHAEYTSRGMDCGIYWFARKSSLEELLINTIDSLSDFLIDESDNTSKIGWENMQYRYDKAQVAIRQAIKNFL